MSGCAQWWPDPHCYSVTVKDGSNVSGGDSLPLRKKSPAPLYSIPWTVDRHPRNSAEFRQGVGSKL